MDIRGLVDQVPFWIWSCWLEHEFLLVIVWQTFVDWIGEEELINWLVMLKYEILIYCIKL